MSAKKYSPKVGDVVTALGQNVILQVVSISDNGITAELQPFNIGKQERFGKVHTLPSSVLSPFKEDASQAAARIVKEATKDR